MAGFIKLKRDENTDALLKEPECFLLLTQIALRARRSDDNGFNPYKLEIGQALIGDFKSIGLSSEKVYRNAKKKLENFGLVAFKGANKGTIATILNSTIYDINANEKGEQKGGQGADEGRTKGRAKGGERATNKEERTIKKKEVKKKENTGDGGLFKEMEILVQMPWNTETFAAAWSNYKEFRRKQHKFEFKSEHSEQAALMELAGLSDGVEETAIKIINQTFAKGWKGLFALKNETNGHTKNGTNGHSTTTGGVDLKTRITSANEKYGY